MQNPCRVYVPNQAIVASRILDMLILLNLYSLPSKI